MGMLALLLSPCYKIDANRKFASLYKVLDELSLNTYVHTYDRGVGGGWLHDWGCLV